MSAGKVTLLSLQAGAPFDSGSLPVEPDDPVAVEIATTAAEALDRISDGGIHCVLAGYDLPESDGIEFLRRVRREAADLPVLLYPESGDEQTAAKAISAGVTDYYVRSDDLEQRTRLTRQAISLAAEYAADRQPEDRWAAAIAASMDGMAILDSNGTYLDMNQAHADIYDYDRETLLGRTWRCLYGPEETERFETEILPTVASRGQWRGEATGRRRSGESFPQVVSLTRLHDGGLVCVVRDITDRKEHERRLRHERDRFEALFENLGEPIVEVEFGDANEPVVRRCNTVFQDVFGVTTADFEDTSLDDVIVPPDRMAQAREINEAAADGEQVEREVRRQTTDELRDFLFRSAPFEGVDGTRYGYGIYIDITRRKQREQQLQQQNERLDEFARIVSHDLTNPLNVASAHAEMAREADDPSEYLETVERMHDRMEALLEDTLTLAQQGQTIEQATPVALPAVAERAWAQVEGEDADLVVTTDARVLADASRLEQLLVNLFENAVAHGDSSPIVRIGTMENGFYVADDGPGVSPDRREEVFTPGHTTSDDGTGYGLAIVKTIAQAHGWDVTLTESEDGGARFEFTDVSFQ